MFSDEKFNRKIDFDGPGGCWLWTGSCGKDGYGLIGRKRDGLRFYRTHRYAWYLMYGDITDELYVCHHCDVRKCVNPEHLFLGTHADNMRDMSDKGRRTGVGWSKPKKLRPPKERRTKGMLHITLEQKRKIRADDRSIREIANDYGISTGRVYYIKNE